MTAVVSVATIAREKRVDAIVVVGGLFDQRSLGVTALPAAMQVLESYGGEVLIAPGALDAYSEAGIYHSAIFGARSRVWTSPDFVEQVVSGVRLLGRARQGEWDPAPQLPSSSEDVTTVLVGEGLDVESAARWARVAPSRHVVTTGTGDSHADVITTLSPVNTDLGQPFGTAALIEVGTGGVIGVSRIPVLQGTPDKIDLDVSAITTTELLLAAVRRGVSAAEPWSVVRLAGALAQGVLLPSVAGFTLNRDDVLLEVGNVTYEFADPDRTDRTALAEFLRSISDTHGEDRARHQAIALGLVALTRNSREQAVL